MVLLFPTPRSPAKLMVVSSEVKGYYFFFPQGLNSQEIRIISGRINKAKRKPTQQANRDMCTILRSLTYTSGIKSPLKTKEKRTKRETNEKYDVRNAIFVIIAA